jgi:hypothetical protein
LEEVFSFWLKIAPLAQGVGKKWFSCHNFGSIQLFFNLFFALVLWHQHANLMEEKFLKNYSRRIFLIFLFHQPTLIFSKTFLPLNLRTDNTKFFLFKCSQANF